jgi:hypothetical protein
MTDAELGRYEIVAPRFDGAGNPLEPIVNQSKTTASAD